jgi:hypothetical protein
VRTLLRYAWAGPATVFGIALATLALWRGRVTVVDGVVEAYGPLLHCVLSHLIPLAGGASAMTFGHVVVGLSAKALDETRMHERVHVRQYERWGPLFVPAYLASSAWALACGRHLYLDNPFEREAFRVTDQLRIGPRTDSHRFLAPGLPTTCFEVLTN